MARLFYEKTDKQPESPIAEDDEQPVSEAGENGQEDGSNYLEKVARLIPGEIIAGYLTLFGFVPLVQKTDIQIYIYWVVFLLCLVLTPIYLNSMATEGKPKRNHLIISTVAFLIWGYVTTGNALMPNLHDPAIASILLVAFSMVSGVIPLNK